MFTSSAYIFLIDDDIPSNQFEGSIPNILMTFAFDNTENFGLIALVL